MSKQALIYSTNSTRPCGLCGLCEDIDHRNGADIGKLCLYFGVRIADDELMDPRSGPRQTCIKQGNYFVWPVKDVKPFELLKWDHERHTQSLAIKKSRIAYVGAVVAIAVSVISLVVSVINAVLPWFTGS